MEHLLFAAEGAAAVGLVWFGCLTMKKGGGWALAKLHGWWNAGKADLAAIKGDVANAQTKAAAVDARVDGQVMPLITQLRADLEELKAKVPG